MAELEDVTPGGASYPLTEGALLGSLRAVDAQRSWTAGGVYAIARSASTPSALTVETLK